MRWIDYLKKVGWKEGQPYTLQEVADFERVAAALQRKEEMKRNLLFKNQNRRGK